MRTNSFDLTPDNTRNITAIIEEIGRYAIGHGDVNELIQVFHFNSQDQLAGEAVHGRICNTIAKFGKKSCN